MKNIEIKQVNKMEAMKYLLPILIELENLNISYEMSDNHIIIDLPRYIPLKKGGEK